MITSEPAINAPTSHAFLNASSIEVNRIRLELPLFRRFEIILKS